MSGIDAAREKVVVVGLGVVSSIGNDYASFWNALCAGVCGIGEVDLFDTTQYRTHTGAQIRDLPASTASNRLRSRQSRCDRLALAAADEALRNSGILGKLPSSSIGLAFGAGAGGMFSAERFRAADLQGMRPDPNDLLPFPCGSTADWLGHTFGLEGPRVTVVTACSSSSTSIGLGLDWLQMGLADAVLVGGSDALSRLTYSGFNALRSVDPDPCRPFDANRKGLSLGESAAFLVLVRESTAQTLALEPHAELAGYAIGCDGYHMTAPDSTGQGAIRTMTSALQQAGVTPDQVDHINAHGTATRFNDLIESKAINQVFGERGQRIPLTAIKSAIGHCLGAAGCIEAVATVLSIQHNLIPPTLQYETPDPECQVNVVHGQALQRQIEVAVSNSFAFGGNNTCLVVRKYREHQS